MSTIAEHNPESLAQRLLNVGWEGLSFQEAEAVNDAALTVGQCLPTPLGIALLNLLDRPVPRDFKGQPPRLGDLELRGRIALRVIRSGLPPASRN